MIKDLLFFLKVIGWLFLAAVVVITAGIFAVYGSILIFILIVIVVVALVMYVLWDDYQTRKKNKK